MKKHILVVDDEADIRFTIRMLLESKGFTVDEASNGREALEFLTGSTPVDLLILDLMMPEVDGYQVLKALDPVTAPPVMLLTAMGQDDDLLRGYREGATYYVTKPFQNKMILAALANLLDDLSDEDRQRLEPDPDPC